MLNCLKSEKIKIYSGMISSSSSKTILFSLAPSIGLSNFKPTLAIRSRTFPLSSPTSQVLHLLLLMLLLLLLPLLTLYLSHRASHLSPQAWKILKFKLPLHKECLQHPPEVPLKDCSRPPPPHHPQSSPRSHPQEENPCFSLFPNPACCLSSHRN